MLNSLKIIVGTLLLSSYLAAMPSDTEPVINVETNSSEVKDIKKCGAGKCGTDKTPAVKKCGSSGKCGGGK